MSHTPPAPGPIRRKSEKAVRDRAGVPVGLLYDEINDKTIMQRGGEEGYAKVQTMEHKDRAVDLFFAQNVGSPTTLTADTVPDAWTVSVTTGHGLVAGDFFVIFDPVAQHGHSAGVVSVAGNNTVNMDRPVSYELFAASAIVQERTIDLDVDGSSTRQVFSIGSSLTATLHITRLMFQIVCTDPALYNLFGDQSALSRGVLFRQTVTDNGTINHWNVKDNSQLANLMYDVSVQDAAKVFNVNGLTGRLTYGSQSKHGVVLAIGGGETLQIIIQDNITGLLSFRIMAQGHLVTD
jgi:hypothetical protein